MNISHQIKEIKVEVKVLEYISDPKGFRQGLVDIKVIYTADKFECFRGLGYFEKENRKWLTFPNTKRGDKWLPYYERSPEINKEILVQALKALESHITVAPVETKEDDSFFDF